MKAMDLLMFTLLLNVSFWVVGIVFQTDVFVSTLNPSTWSTMEWFIAAILSAFGTSAILLSLKLATPGIVAATVMGTAYLGYTLPALRAALQQVAGAFPVISWAIDVFVFITGASFFWAVFQMAGGVPGRVVE